MTEDVSHELQVAIIARLRADADVVGLIGNRVFDRVPVDAQLIDTAKFPFVSFGPEQEIPIGAECIDGAELYIQLDAWSRDPGYREVRRIAKAVKRALTEVHLEITENALIYFEFDSRRIMRDPDGLTSHAVLIFRAGVEST